MPAKSPLNLILGTGNVGDKSLDPMARFDTPDEVTALLTTFHSRGYTRIDTAQLYSPHAPGSCEPRLGAVNAGSRFSLDTKVSSQEPGSHSRANIEASINRSLAALKVKQIDVQYLHRPDRDTSFEETAEALDKAYREGKFRRFGLSNYTAEEVAQFVEISERRGFVGPSVYQGQYNPLVRGGEEELFPLLRKYGIAFYAWSPAGAGFFAGNHKNIQAGGRFDQSLTYGKVYADLYFKPAIQAATDHALAVAAKHGIKGHAAALRWTVYHSSLSAEFGDAVIIGASSPEQLVSNLDMIDEGPLPQEVADAIGALYKEVGEDGIPYHF